MIPRLSEDEPVLLTGKANGRGVDNRSHFLDVFRYKLVKELLVTIQKTRQVNVLVKVIGKTVDIGQNSFHLFVLCEDNWRQQAVNSKQLTLFQGKCHSLQKGKNHQFRSHDNSEINFSLKCKKLKT